MGYLVVFFFGLVAIATFLHFVPIRLWIATTASGAPVGMGQLVAMRLRRVNPSEVVNPLIGAVKAGVNVPVGHLEAHLLAGGNVDHVVRAIISAEKAGIHLSFARAAAIDLAGRDVLEAVRMSVNPAVIQTPRVAAMAKDGIQVSVICRVTLRANLDRLVGGAGEETILARVGEGIVTTIGSADSHKEVLMNPDSISRVVAQRGLDSGTAFEILSIDIADVDVGANIGAKLQTDQAEADKSIAQARAESRRAMAVAIEQENVAAVAAARARVIEAEAEVPRGIAAALAAGRFGYANGRPPRDG